MLNKIKSKPYILHIPHLWICTFYKLNQDRFPLILVHAGQFPPVFLEQSPVVYSLSSLTSKK